MMLVTTYGSISLYVLMSGRQLEKVGDALKIAAALFVPYLVASLLVGWATLAGFFPARYALQIVIVHCIFHIKQVRFVSAWYALKLLFFIVFFHIKMPMNKNCQNQARIEP